MGRKLPAKILVPLVMETENQWGIIERFQVGFMRERGSSEIMEKWRRQEETETEWMK